MSLALPAPLLRPEEAAKRLNLTVATLAAWRCHTPSRLPFVKINRTIRYCAADVEQFIAMCKRGRTGSDANPGARVSSVQAADVEGPSASHVASPGATVDRVSQRRHP